MKIQAIFKTYTGKAVSVYAMYQEGILVVGKVTNSDDITEGMDLTIADDISVNPDFVFKEESINKAINRFFMLDKSNALIIDNSLTRADPKTAVEFEGIENGKRSYRIRPEIKNEQVAVLAIANAVSDYELNEDSIDLLDDLRFDDASDLELLNQGLGITI